ncbi:MAG TPA: ABC transporter permease [Syntrophomonadaceae bacterium]|nr:ABC transporter permease [Syntrophomonadaceae bacterium]
MKKIIDKSQDYFSQILLGITLLLAIILLSSLSPHFFTWGNIRNILDQSALLVIMGVGMTLVICTAGIDLSIGAVVALSGVCMAVAMHSGIPVEIAILIGLTAGTLVGLMNGFIISAFNINPFIVTLGTMSVTRGIALIITAGIPIYGFGAAFSWLGKAFTWWGSGHIGPVNPPMLIGLGIALLGAIILNYTKLGSYALALGGNEEALHRSGIATKNYKVIIYGICGFTAALAGLVVTARLNTAEPLAGYMFELDAIAAVVLGGTDMKGGRGSISGTVIACLLLGVLRNGLTIMSIPSYYQQLAIGLIILIAVITSELRFRNTLSRSNA